MRNRAKCKKCNSVIESYHATDMVFCKCGEIYVDGGDALQCGAGDFSNFIRVDDKGNEIVVKVMEKDSEKKDVNPLYSKKPDRNELIKMFEEITNSYDRLPQGAMEAACTNYDLHSCMFLILQILKSSH